MAVCMDGCVYAFIHTAILLRMRRALELGGAYPLDVGLDPEDVVRKDNLVRVYMCKFPDSGHTPRRRVQLQIDLI